MGGATGARGHVQENSGRRGRPHREYHRAYSRGQLSYRERADWHRCERQRKKTKETAGGSNSRGGRISWFGLRQRLGGFGRHGDWAGWAKPQVLEGLTFTPPKVAREIQGQMPGGRVAAG